MERYFIPTFNTDLVLRFSNVSHQLPVSQYLQGTLTSLTLERTSSYRKMLPSPSWFFPHTGHTLEDVLYNMALISESTRGQSPTKWLGKHDHTDFTGPDNSAANFRPNGCG